jgi:DNA-binding transcriptional regulator GbsR (MarR family)
MAQHEIYNYIKKCKGRWVPSSEIKEKMKVSAGVVNVSLKSLRRFNLVQYFMHPKLREYYYKL